MKTLIMRKLLVAVALVELAATAQAEPREKREPNWIIERQRIGAVQGVPTSRRIIGKREIDIYPNGMMFEKGNLVGITR
jgi:hypothetical protein